MKTLPKVSILFCAYNQKPFLESALESLSAQTYPNLEVIAVDNGSTDGSREIFEKYRNHPSFKLLLFEKNGPVTDRLNQAFSLSTGDYVGLLYGDDYYLPSFVQKAIQTFSNLDETYGVVYTKGYRENVLTGKRWEEKLLTKSGNVLEHMLTHWFHGSQMNPISAISRRRAFESHPFLKTLFTEGESIYLRIALSEKFFYLDEPLVVMRDHASNIGKALKKNRETVLEVLRNLETEKEFPSSLGRELLQCRMDTYRHYAWQSIRVLEDRAWALQCIEEGMKLSPQFLLHPKSLAVSVLTRVPDTILRVINNVGHKLRRHSMVLSHRGGYS